MNYHASLKQKVVLNISKKEAAFEKVKIITGYVHNLFSHDGAMMPKSLSPFDIIEAAEHGVSMRCVEYSFLLVALLETYDVSSRVLGLKKKTLETDKEGAGHVVVEYWDPEHEKWVMVDPQEGLIPLDGEVPLSAYELSELIKSNRDPKYDWLEEVSADDENYTNWIKEYLYYYDTAVRPNYFITNEERLKEQKIMLVPNGGSSPKVFQGIYPISAVYTSSVEDFYKKPTQ